MTTVPKCFQPQLISLGAWLLTYSSGTAMLSKILNCGYRRYGTAGGCGVKRRRLLLPWLATRSVRYLYCGICGNHYCGEIGRHLCSSRAKMRNGAVSQAVWWIRESRAVKILSRSSCRNTDAHKHDQCQTPKRATAQPSAPRTGLGGLMASIWHRANRLGVSVHVCARAAEMCFPIKVTF